MKCIPMFRCEDFDRECMHVWVGQNAYTHAEKCSCGADMVHVADILPGADLAPIGQNLEALRTGHALPLMEETR